MHPTTEIVLTSYSHLRLVPFSPAGRLAVEVRWQVVAKAAAHASPVMRVEFEVEDPEQSIVWPAHSKTPTRRDELWKHTCMELFFGIDRGNNYCEVNISPGGDWAFYCFDRYRERASFAGEPAAPKSITVTGDSGRRTIGFEIDVRRVHDLIGHPPWRWQPTAVLESVAGRSYWAPSHPSQQADFHRLEHLPAFDPYHSGAEPQ
jgi:hypothetical protein